MPGGPALPWRGRGGMVAAMLERLQEAANDSLRALGRRWPLVLALLLAGGWLTFAVALSDTQGRMDLPRAYGIRMTCEDDPEAALWRGGCERIAADIARSERPGFAELYAAFVVVHHEPAPEEVGASGASAAEAAAASAGAGFDVAPLLEGQRYGLAAVRPAFAGVGSRAEAEAVIAAIDRRDRALLVIGRAGLGHDALLAGALANLVHPRAMLDGLAQYAAIWMGTAKTSDFTPGAARR